ncbi:sensor histidine kinase [uncultured Microbacterium sp.]|uniref:sensor histidine kinase n=1 Tax=uncultured Microbacterium sp. TaxID=191216 RepID=UPI0035C9DB89
MTSLSTPASPAPLRPGPPRPVWSYGALWRRVPGSAVYLLSVFALAIASVVVLATLFWTGVGLLILVIGLPIIVMALLVARGFGVADRFLLRLTGLPAIVEPEWSHDAPDADRFWMTLTRPVRNAHYWLSLVHGMIVSPIISTVSFTITTVWLSVSLGGLTYWFWGPFIPQGDGRSVWGDDVRNALPLLFGALSQSGVEVLLYVLAGVFCAATLPWVLGALTAMHHAIAGGMLGRWRSDDLAAQVRAESLARDAAVHAEDVALRRLERDIHDGPQQRLVRLQMDLAALERRAEAGDGDAAASLAREARTHAKAALDELRALSSGVAPPLLQDRGLVAALGALAVGSGLPVHLDIDPALDEAVSPEIARTIYFTVAELLTNAVKHAGATAATVKAAQRPIEPGSAPGTTAMLDVWVVDNGRGGAHLAPGHGLDGLRDRLAGLRGELVVQSPLGGPTTIGAHVPLPARIAEQG